MNLTDHFTLEELTFSSTAERLGIDNTPSLNAVARLTATAMQMEAVRALLGGPLHVDSGYRCEALERALTAKDYAAWCNRHGQQVNAASWAAYFATKAHPSGNAVDFTCAAFGDPLAIVKRIVASSIRFDQLIQEGSWVHISFAPAMRQQVLTATFKAGTPTYTAGA